MEGMGAGKSGWNGNESGSIYNGTGRKADTGVPKRNSNDFRRHVFRVLMLSVLLAVFLRIPLSARAAVRYHTSAALSYAAAHWDDGKGLCAEFVSDCINAGGISAWSTSCTLLRNQLLNTGAGVEYRIPLESDKSIKASSYTGMLAAGDVVFFYCPGCTDGRPYIHAVLSNGMDSNGYMKAYSHNAANPGTSKYKYISSCYACGTPISHAYVYHFTNGDKESRIRFASSSLYVPSGSSREMPFTFQGDGIARMTVEVGNGEICQASWGSTNWTTGVSSLSLMGKKNGTTNVTVNFQNDAGTDFYSKSFQVTVAAEKGPVWVAPSSIALDVISKKQQEVVLTWNFSNGSKLYTPYDDWEMVEVEVKEVTANSVTLLFKAVSEGCAYGWFRIRDVYGNEVGAVPIELRVTKTKKAAPVMETREDSCLKGIISGMDMELEGCLPADCENPVFHSPIVSGDVTYQVMPYVSDGRLKYDLGRQETAGTGSIRVRVSSDNYEDIMFTILITRRNQREVCVQDGSAVRPVRDTLKTGEVLDALDFQPVVFTDALTGEEVAGILSWKESGQVMGTEDMSVCWTFQPNDREYRPLEGWLTIFVDAELPPEDSEDEPTEPGIPADPSEPSTDPSEDPSDPPADPSEDPSDPSESPTEPSEDPADPSDPPTDPSEDPADPSDPPADPSEDPADPSDPPADPSEDPADPSVPPADPADPVNPPAEPSSQEKPWPFEDIPVNSGWKYDYVKAVYEKGIMNGISGTNLFQPDGNLSRGMFAAVLYRMSGEPAVKNINPFSDVEGSRWYTGAVLWVNAQGIARGYDNGKFGVNDNITREQITKMLYEYARQCGYDVQQQVPLDTFTDCSQLSSWAGKYMGWAVAQGIITGKPNGDGTFRLDPRGFATRAECAKILENFMKYYGMKMPVSLKLLTKTAGYQVKEASVAQFGRDGRIYGNAVSYDASSNAYGEYMLAKKYTEFSGSVFLSPAAAAGKKVSVRIYVDGELCCSIEDVTENDPTQQFRVDVTGGETLRIETSNSGSYSHGWIYIANTILL